MGFSEQILGQEDYSMEGDHQQQSCKHPMFSNNFTQLTQCHYWDVTPRHSD